ncbi:MAG: histidine phosphatase family protein [Microscillaceae bacterium]
MATIYLIRHGQASFMEANYDVLSEKGHQQALQLGEYLAQRGLHFEAVYRGTLKRHEATYAGVAEAYIQVRGNFPEAHIHEGLNEHQAAEIHYRHLPQLLAQPENQALRQAYEARGRQDPEVKKGLLRLFFQSTRLWALGQMGAPGDETFADFKARVQAGWQALQAQFENLENILLFSSGGTIAVWLGLILELSDEKIIELNWQIRNGSITELSYSKGKFYLRGFNQTAHYDAFPELLTYV